MHAPAATATTRPAGRATAAAAGASGPTPAPISMDPPAPRSPRRHPPVTACGSPLHTGVLQATFMMAPFSRCDPARKVTAGGVVGTGATRRGQAGIIDVARRAGVSPSTVSRSLRGSAKVSQQTRERVLRAAAELEYVPSPAASRLASGRTSAIGVIVPFETRWFFSEVLTGASSFSRAEQDALGALDVPVAVVGGHVAGFPRVGIDDEAGAAMATRHLLLLGHREVVMISGDPADPIGRVTTSARRRGFERALTEAGLPTGADRMVAEPWGVIGGMRGAEQLLSRRRLPTAIFAESDEMALGALQTLRKAGLAVPGRVSLIGFDDHEMAAAGDLTTVAQPVRRQGELAADCLLAALTGGPAGPGAEATADV